MLTNKDLQNIGKLIALEIDPLKQEYGALKASDTEQNKQIQELAEHTNYTFKTS